MAATSDQMKNEPEIEIETESYGAGKGQVDRREHGSDFVKGVTTSVVSWFPTLPAIIKWVFAALFLWYVFAALAQIDPKAPFIGAGDAAKTIVDDFRAEHQVELNERSMFQSFLKSELSQAHIDRKELEAELRTRYQELDRRLIMLEATHMTKGSNSRKKK